MAQKSETECLDPPTPATRPVGGTEFSWCKAVPIGTGSTVLSLLLSKPPQIPLLQNALHKLQNSHPILRSKIQLDHSTNNFTFVTPPNAHVQIQPFDLQSTSHILQTRSDGDDPIDPFHALLEHEMNRDTWRDPKAEDNDVMYASSYEIGDERFAVFLRLHTSACDRAAAVSLLKELLRLVAAGGGDDEGGVREEKVNPAIEDMIPEGKTNKPFWARGLDVLGYSLNALRFANLSFVNAESPRSSRIVRFQLNAEETKSLLAGPNFVVMARIGEIIAKSWWRDIGVPDVNHFQLKVMDHSSSAMFTITDEVACKFFGMEYVELIDSLLDDGYTKQLGELFNKNYLFEVKCPADRPFPNESNYEVASICMEIDIIDQFQYRMSSEEYVCYRDHFRGMAAAAAVSMDYMTFDMEDDGVATQLKRYIF